MARKTLRGDSIDPADSTAPGEQGTMGVALNELEEARRLKIPYKTNPAEQAAMRKIANELRKASGYNNRIGGEVRDFLNRWSHFYVRKDRWIVGVSPKDPSKRLRVFPILRPRAPTPAPRRAGSTRLPRPPRRAP